MHAPPPLLKDCFAQQQVVSSLFGTDSTLRALTMVVCFYLAYFDLNDMVEFRKLDFGHDFDLVFEKSP